MPRTRPGFAALALLSLAALCLGSDPATAAGGKTVAVTAIVEHPALDAVRDGVRDELAAEGFGPDTLTFTYESAQGNPGTAVQIARQFAGSGPDVIVPISTPSAQAVVAATQDIPVVFSAVTDPVGAQLVANLEKPGANVTGVSDMAPVADNIALIQELAPAAKRIGVIYNPGEPNSVVLVDRFKLLATGKGLTVAEAVAPRSADVQGAAQSLVGKVDALFVPTDNTIVSALEAVVGVGADNRLPVFAADTDSVARGAVAAVGFNYYQVGRTTGKLVVRVLKGEKPGAIPVVEAGGSDIAINVKAAAGMGVTVPPAVLSRASKVVGR